MTFKGKPHGKRLSKRMKSKGKRHVKSLNIIKSKGKPHGKGQLKLMKSKGKPHGKSQDMC